METKIVAQPEIKAGLNVLDLGKPEYKGKKVLFYMDVTPFSHIVSMANTIYSYLPDAVIVLGKKALPSYYEYKSSLLLRIPHDTWKRHIKQEPGMIEHIPKEVIGRIRSEMGYIKGLVDKKQYDQFIQRAQKNFIVPSSIYLSEREMLLLDPDVSLAVHQDVLFKKNREGAIEPRFSYGANVIDAVNVHMSHMDIIIAVGAPLPQEFGDVHRWSDGAQHMVVQRLFRASQDYGVAGFRDARSYNFGAGG